MTQPFGPQSRRRFLTDVGQGMLVAGVGLGTALDMGLASASAGQEPAALTFGALEPLVAFMQETPPERIVSACVAKLKGGTDLRTLVSAAALANARTFGGEDYVGFHTLMAMAPAFHMASEMPNGRAALPVLKVIRRNTGRIAEAGGRSKEVLHPVNPVRDVPGDEAGALALREAVRSKDVGRAEGTFAGIALRGNDEAFNDLLYSVQDNTEVHRVVLPYRAWDLLSLIGPEHAQSLLRQSVRYCVKSERDWRHDGEVDRPRTLLPKLFDQFKLAGKTRGTRSVDDDWVGRMTHTLFTASAESAAEAAAAALAEGIAPDAIGEAIALAANQLVLRDEGRTGSQVQPGKPEGSVHGDSIGVHACDSANAWRNMARVTNDRNIFACLILGAYQVAHDRTDRGGDFQHWRPRPRLKDFADLGATNPATLLKECESAIRANNQALACATVQRYGETGASERPVFDLLLKYAVSEDGALHAEKYYRTVSEEFANARPAFRWRHLVALARVTASEYGKPAPGVEEASGLIGA